MGRTGGEGGWFPISRDPPEGGTFSRNLSNRSGVTALFPISRDPPEGGTPNRIDLSSREAGFQFLGIPPKGERVTVFRGGELPIPVSNF